jgi:hypothetical protein
MIKADNYNYTKNITQPHVDKFENDVKKVIDDISSKFELVIEFYFDDESFSDIKRTIANVYDFLKSEISDVKIIFDGGNKFQIWSNTSKQKDSKYFKKIINEKFKDSPYHNLKFVKNKIKLLKINKETGLVSTEIKRKNLIKFKKRENVLDSVYSKITKNKFDWKLKKSNYSSDKTKKIVQDYFKFKHDQLDEMYKNINDPKYKDRDQDNFYRQLQLLKDAYKSSSSPLMSAPPYVGDMLEYIKNRQQNDPQLMNLITSYLENKIAKKNVDNEDLRSAFSKFWNSPIVKRKGKLVMMPLKKTFSLNFKTLHSSNLSEAGKSEDWAEKIRDIMQKPIVVLQYSYPDDDEANYYVLDGSHRYNEASTKNEYRLNPELDYDDIPVFLVHLEEKDKELDPEFFDWLTNKRIPNGNWS